MIVREGRPAVLIKNNRISQDEPVADTTAKVMLDRLKVAAPILEPLIPFVGRIDLANYPGSLPYAGTGWLVQPNLVVTNRHVANLIANSNDGQYRFRPGRFGEELQVSIDYRHELGVDATAASKVLDVLWIEPDSGKSDIAFLKVGATHQCNRAAIHPACRSGCSGESPCRRDRVPGAGPLTSSPTSSGWSRSMDRITTSSASLPDSWGR